MRERYCVVLLKLLLFGTNYKEVMINSKLIGMTRYIFFRNDVISPGEMQRLSFIRLFFHCPTYAGKFCF